MKNKDLQYVVDFYQNVICQQIIKPIECEKAYRMVKPDGAAVPYYQKMRAISVYVQGLQQEVLDDLEQLFTDFDEDQDELKATQDPRSKDYIPEDSAASPSQPDDTQSHSEDLVLTIASGTTEYKMNLDGLVSDDLQPDEKQSHSRNHDLGDTQEDNEDPTYVKVSQPLDGESELQKLQREYEKATTANEKRSLKMRINKLKKQ